MWSRISRMASVSVTDLKRKSNGQVGSVAAKKPASHWAMGLKTSMEDPELKVEEDEKIVIIKDKYPKVPVPVQTSHKTALSLCQCTDPLALRPRALI